MKVCEYYLRGFCRYGDRCRNEHPLLPDSQGGLYRNQSWQASTNTNKVAFPYTTETLENDVTPMKEKPLWPLSSYGASKFEPVLVGGLDESPEELRLKAATAIKEGRVHEYMKHELDKTTAADQIYENARNNIPQFYEQAVKVSQPSLSSATNIFGSSSSVSGSGSSSAPGGTSTFGTPASSSTPASSAFGTTNTSAFGKPGFGQAVFGQSGFGATPGASSAFGQGSQGSSAFGQLAQTPSAFGGSMQPTSVFGQPSALGAAVQPPSAFGPPAAQPTSAFGQPPQPTSAFGQPSQPTSTFGQSSLIKPGSGAFGAPSTGAFGGGGGFSVFATQPSSLTSAAASNAASSAPPTGSAFGQPAFGATASAQSAFATTTPQTVFGAPSPFGAGAGAAPASAFGATPSGPVTSPPNSAVSAGSPFATSPTTTVTVGTTGTTATGAPDFAFAKSRTRAKLGADIYVTFLPPNYMDLLPAEVKTAFLGDRFEWGKIPEWIPPNEVR
ncbi:hypothetical protein F5I97DRAFT_816387 [Phlebopus sp. FC_14]|nr:hypothetical protein F5I97DRAFT_816387 [Phlebopus sp. FC_14]